MILSDFHAHTRYCDGKASPEEMVQAAVKLGCVAFGLSGHAPLDRKCGWCMTPDSTAVYLAEIDRLKRKYAGQIELYAGFEADLYSPPLPNCDYIIGSLHFVEQNGERFSVDDSEKLQRHTVRESFGGDYYAFCAAYYSALAGVLDATGADIVGHFDLVTKYNEGGKYFDESDQRYRKAALSALDALLKAGKPFEINTGAMSRGYRTAPYPSRFILTEIKNRNGRIILNSDAHSPSGIRYAFDTARDLALSCGFTTAVTLSSGSLIEYKL